MSLKVSGEASLNYPLPSIKKCKGMPVYDPRKVLAHQLVERGDFDKKIVKIYFNIINSEEKSQRITNTYNGQQKCDFNKKELEKASDTLKQRLNPVIANSMFDAFLHQYSDVEAKEMLKELNQFNAVFSSKLEQDIKNNKNIIKEKVEDEFINIINDKDNDGRITMLMHEIQNPPINHECQQQ